MRTYLYAMMLHASWEAPVSASKAAAGVPDLIRQELRQDVVARAVKAKSKANEKMKKQGETSWRVTRDPKEFCCTVHVLSS